MTYLAKEILRGAPEQKKTHAKAPDKSPFGNGYDPTFDALSEEQQADLYEIICDRYERASSIITSNRDFAECQWSSAIPSWARRPWTAWCIAG